MTELTLNVERRNVGGTNTCRRLRADGKVPAVIYGGDADSVAIQVDRKEIVGMIRSAGENSVFLLTVPGTGDSRHTMIRDLQLDPLENRILHVDFQRIDITRKVRVRVAVEAIGEAEGVKNEGGIIDFVLREVEVECLPGLIPERLEVDVSELHIGMHSEAGDLQLPEGVELIEDESRVLLSVAAPKMAEEEETEEEGEDLIVSEADEPEVVGSRDDESEDDE